MAPNGSDNAAGSEAAPFGSVQRAQDAASPGDTVFLRGGTYVFTGNAEIGVLFDKDGAPGQPISYVAYPGETPVFDFFQLLPQARIRGFSVRASWLVFRGFELRGVQQTLVDVNESWGIRVENGASNDVFEQLDIHHNEGPGLFINDGGDNLVLNVDSHHNWDGDRGGENADGFGCHSNDAGNVFRGCRAFRNSDDGFDFINAPGGCTVEGSWAFYNGYVPDTFTAEGNGNGIKAGGFGLDAATFPNPVPRHLVRFNVAFGNLAAGFYANHHPGGGDWFNNTAFDNPRNFDMLADVGAADHLLRNNLALAPGMPIARFNAGEIDDDVNSWTLPVEVSQADFVSLAEEQALLPRQADGSLPNVDFLQLAPESDLIDRGEDRGFPFNDAAPDLGAFETGGPLPLPGQEAPPGNAGEVPPGSAPEVPVAPGLGVAVPGMDVTGSPGGVPNAGPPDVGVGAPDLAGGGEPSPSLDPSLNPMGMGGARESGGCACRLQEPRGSSAPLAWLGLLALSALLRRAAHRSAPHRSSTRRAA